MLCSHQRCMTSQVSPHPHRYLLLLFFILVILIDVFNDTSLWFYFSIFITANDVEHLILCLFAICVFLIVISVHVLCPSSN